MRLAIPKGHLYKEVMALLERAGIIFAFKSDRDYNPTCNYPGLRAKLVRPQATPQLITLGNFQAGFCGLDLLRESGYDEMVEPILDLGLSAVRLVVAVPVADKDILKNPPKRPVVIATEYEQIAADWAIKKGLSHIIIQTYGSTEAYAPEDADIIFDCVETGATIKANGLVIIEEILKSTTHLIVGKKILEDPVKRSEIDGFVCQLKKTLEGK
jgi:ATP phosphoribosyltransferase